MAYVLVLVLTPGAIWVARLSGRRLLLPLLTALAIYVPFLWEIRTSVLRGFLLLLFWVLVQSAHILFYSFCFPAAMEKLIWRSREYTESMFGWIESGILPEGSSFSVLVAHLRQALLFCALALLTGNFVSLILGSALLNYMNYYVAQVARQSREPWLAFVMAWNPWSILRVAAFLWLATVLSIPLLSRILSTPDPWSWRLLIPGLLGVVLDLALKLAMSDAWRIRLKQNWVR